MDIFKKIIKYKITIMFLIGVIVLISLNAIFDSDNKHVLLITSILISVFSSFLVGVYYNFQLKDDFAREHSLIINHKEEFNKSGIVKYSGSFKDMIEDLRGSIRGAKEVAIYLTYGSTIINMISEDLNYFLSQPNTKFNLYIMHKENPFVPAYEDLWRYEKGELGRKIDNTAEILQDKVNELSRNKTLKGKVCLNYLKKYPVNYSFYKCDNILYFVPSKHYASKEFVPLVIKAQKTIDEKAIYNKINSDIELIVKSNDGIEKVELKPIV